MGWTVLALVCIVVLVILYYVIRTAVRDGIMDAWRIRTRVEKENAVWNPESGRGGF